MGQRPDKMKSRKGGFGNMTNEERIKEIQAGREKKRIWSSYGSRIAAWYARSPANTQRLQTGKSCCRRAIWRCIKRPMLTTQTKGPFPRFCTARSPVPFPSISGVSRFLCLRTESGSRSGSWTGWRILSYGTTAVFRQAGKPAACWRSHWSS